MRHLRWLLRYHYRHLMAYVLHSELGWRNVEREFCLAIVKGQGRRG